MSSLEKQPDETVGEQDIARTQSEISRGAVARTAGLLGMGNVASRLLGLLRDTAIYYFFGASGAVSAFRTAWRVPQFLYDLLIGGQLSAALVPVLSDYTPEERRHELWRIASIFLSLATAALAIVVLLIEVGAPWIIALIGGGFPLELQQLAARLLRLIAPALLFMGLSGAVTGLLYSLKRFLYPSIAAALLNGGIILVVVVAAGRIGIVSVALGVALGALLQLVVQLPGLRGARLRPALDLSHPALRKILRLYLPVVLGVVIGMVGTIIDRRLASGTGESSIAWMDGATTLIQTPLGLIAAAVALAVLPSLSRADTEGDEARYQAALGLGLRLILTLVVPATVGLLALGRPVVALLFEHGRFTSHDTTMVTWALGLYLIGLPFAAVDQLLIFAFYARKNTLLPNLVQVYAIAIYLLFALPFVRPWGMFSLVIANSAQWTWHTLLMLLLLRRRMGWPRGQRIGATLLRSTLAASVTGVAAWGTARLVGQAVGLVSLPGRLITVAAGMAVAIGVYLGLAALLRLEEVHVAWKALRARLGGR